MCAGGQSARHWHGREEQQSCAALHGTGMAIGSEIEIVIKTENRIT
jgi:hypothetical protein